jgi:hypothetical protein
VLKSSDPDRVDKINPSYIESAIFSILRIDLVELIKMKAALAKAFHIQPSEIDKMPMWEYEIFVMKLNELVQEENDKQKKEMAKHHVDEYMDMARPGNMKKMMSNPQQQMPKVANTYKMK